VCEENLTLGHDVTDIDELVESCAFRESTRISRVLFEEFPARLSPHAGRFLSCIRRDICFVKLQENSKCQLPACTG
jgi:hypothetical protein